VSDLACAHAVRVRSLGGGGHYRRPRRG
jgi:hypothetical protein